MQPRASRNALRVESDGRVRVALTAPPVEGAANEALIAFLAKAFGLPKRAVTLVKGQKTREKVIALSGITDEDLRCRLSVHMTGAESGMRHLSSGRLWKGSCGVRTQ